MTRMSLPPGYRFKPTDVELIMYYLKRKILGKKLHSEAISELNIYRFSPWDLPDKSCLKSEDLEWYFFCPRERKYSSGDRMKRGTETGYWKTTGKDRSIMYDERVVGMVKTLVFHEGSAPRGKRTDWVIYEYRMNDKKLADAGVAQDGYVLYKVFKKNGPGPKNGAQYGAPFVEDEWDNDDSVIAIDVLPRDGSSSIVITTSENQDSASKSLINPVCRSGLSIGGSGATVQTSPDEALVDGLTHSMVTDTFGPPATAGCSMNGQNLSSARSSIEDFTHTPNDDVAHLLAAFLEDGPSFPNEQGNYEVGESSHGKCNIALPHLHGNDAFNGLEDLSTWAKLSGGVNFSHVQGHNMNNVLAQDDMAFLELNDLDTPLNFSVESDGFQKVPTDSSYVARNPDASQHLSGISSTQHNFSANLGQIYCDANFPSSQTVFPRLGQCSMLPNSSRRPEDSTNVFPTGNAYQNIFSQGYTAGYNLHSFSYTQAEEFVDGAKNQERGVPQSKKTPPFSVVHTASVAAEHHAHATSNSAYGGSSSIHVKAEVTCGFSSCTKDALSVMLEESTYDYSCWWNLHGAEFWKKAADCSNGYGRVCCVPHFFIGTTSLLLFLEIHFLCFTCYAMMLIVVLGKKFLHEMLNNLVLFIINYVGLQSNSAHLIMNPSNHLFFFT